MERQTVIAGLKAYRGIEEAIQHKLMFAEEAGDGDQFRQEAEELRRVKKEIIQCLNELPPLEFKAVWYHYIRGEVWAWVSRKCAYSERQIRNISRKGLDRLSGAFEGSPEVAAFCARSEAADTY